MNPVSIPGVSLVALDAFSDARGGFECLWEAGQADPACDGFRPSSANVSYNDHRHTLRGMHFQSPPHEQAKLVTCVSGAILDVVVDLRRDSSTYGAWMAEELEAGSARSLYVPRGCAHGFLTLVDLTTVVYLIEGAYRPESAAGFAWNDESVAIDWPVDDPILSERDRNAPPFPGS